MAELDVSLNLLLIKPHLAHLFARNLPSFLSCYRILVLANLLMIGLRFIFGHALLESRRQLFLHLHHLNVSLLHQRI